MGERWHRGRGRCCPSQKHHPRVATRFALCGEHKAFDLHGAMAVGDARHGVAAEPAIPHGLHHNGTIQLEHVGFLHPRVHCVRRRQLRMGRFVDQQHLVWQQVVRRWEHTHLELGALQIAREHDDPPPFPHWQQRTAVHVEPPAFERKILRQHCDRLLASAQPRDIERRVPFVVQCERIRAGMQQMLDREGGIRVRCVVQRSVPLVGLVDEIHIGAEFEQVLHDERIAMVGFPSFLRARDHERSRTFHGVVDVQHGARGVLQEQRPDAHVIELLRGVPERVVVVAACTENAHGLCVDGFRWNELLLVDRAMFCCLKWVQSIRNVLEGKHAGMLVAKPHAPSRNTTVIRLYPLPPE